jgi:hypothetical protein
MTMSRPRGTPPTTTSPSGGAAAASPSTLVGSSSTGLPVTHVADSRATGLPSTFTSKLPAARPRIGCPCPSTARASITTRSTSTLSRKRMSWSAADAATADAPTADASTTIKRMDAIIANDHDVTRSGRGRQRRPRW